MAGDILLRLCGQQGDFKMPDGCRAPQKHTPERQQDARMGVKSWERDAGRSAAPQVTVCDSGQRGSSPIRHGQEYFVGTWGLKFHVPGIDILCSCYNSLRKGEDAALRILGGQSSKPRIPGIRGISVLINRTWQWVG